MEIRHVSHQHMLNLVEVGKDTDAVRCVGCCSFFHGPAYTCKQCHDFFLHKSCVELPLQMKNHAFHQEHSLTLYPMDAFVCDGCGELCMGFVYRCVLCMFSLDVKCATLNQELARSTAQKGKEIKIIINHFSHSNQLTRCIFLTPPSEMAQEHCCACKQDIYGKLIYVCLSCGFILHESCLNNMPEQIKSSFDLEHPLLARTTDTVVECGGCSDEILGIGFSCIECNFDFHVSCAKYQNRAIKNNCHVHPLLHLEKSNFARQRSDKCDKCGEYLKEAFLCCKECKFYIHLECVPLPSIVKHSHHLHLLMLKNSVVEDDSGEYYCDICEEERNPNHYVYFCEECTYVAHIHCVMFEVEPPERISSRQITSKTDGKLLQGVVIEHTRTEQEQGEVKSFLDTSEEVLKTLKTLPTRLLELEEKSVWYMSEEVLKMLKILHKRLRELANKRQHILKSLDDKLGL